MNVFARITANERGVVRLKRLERTRRVFRVKRFVKNKLLYRFQ